MEELRGTVTSAMITTVSPKLREKLEEKEQGAEEEKTLKKNEVKKILLCKKIKVLLIMSSLSYVVDNTYLELKPFYREL